MDVVRLPIDFNGLGRSLLLHEEDAFEPYTLTIPDFDLVTKAHKQHFGAPRNAHSTWGSTGTGTHPTAT